MTPKLDKALLQRAQALANKGLPITDVARLTGVGRSTLYLYGIRRNR